MGCEVFRCKLWKLGYALPLSIFISSNEQGVPQRVQLRSSTIHQLGQVFVDLGRSKSMFVLLGKFLDDEVVQQRLDVLEI